MKVLRRTRIGSLLLGGVVAVAGIYACSSSSEDIVEDFDPGPGPSSQAQMDETNVNDALDEIVKALPECSRSGSISASSIGKSAENLSATVGLARQLVDFARSGIDGRPVKSAAHQAVSPMATTTEPITEIAGNCGGSLSGSISTNEETGDMSGNIIIENYCQQSSEGTTLEANGDFSFDGNINPLTSMTQINASSSGLSIKSGTDYDMTAGFDLSLTMTDSGMTVNADSFFVESNASGHRFSGQNVVLSTTVDETDMSTTVSLSGAFVDSEDGSMVITTITPLTVVEGTVTSGSGTVSGAGGSEVLITATGGNQFEVEVDSDGDGQYDDMAETMDCSSFDASSFGLPGM